jgi:hypothetical protein
LIYIWHYVFPAYAVKLSSGLPSVVSSASFLRQALIEEVTREGSSSSFEIKFRFLASQ